MSLIKNYLYSNIYKYVCREGKHTLSPLQIELCQVISLKTSKGKQQIIYKGILIRLTADLSGETL